MDWILAEIPVWKAFIGAFISVVIAAFVIDSPR